MKNKKMSKERILMRIVGLLPKTLVYWCGIHIWANATIGEYSKTDASRITFSEAIQRFKK